MITSLALLAALAVPTSAGQMRAADCAKMPRDKRFALVLTTKTPRVRMGSVPGFAVTMINCSGKALNISAGFPQSGPLDSSFQLYITDPEGKRVLPGFYHRFSPGGVYTGNRTFGLTHKGGLPSPAEPTRPTRLRVHIRCFSLNYEDLKFLRACGILPRPGFRWEL